MLRDVGQAPYSYHFQPQHALAIEMAATFPFHMSDDISNSECHEIVGALTLGLMICRLLTMLGLAGEQTLKAYIFEIWMAWKYLALV